MSTSAPTRPRAAAPPPASPAVGRPLPLPLIVLLAELTLLATGYGLLADQPYRDVPPLQQAIWQAQDVVTTAVAPLLVVAAVRAARGSLRAHVMTTGLALWLAYAYAHFAIGTPFTAAFPVYLAIMGIAAFVVLDGLIRVDVHRIAAAVAGVPRRATTWFLVVAGVGMAGLWLSDIVPALPGGLPREVHLAELPNPTWVLDLVVLIPMSLAAARLLHRRHPAGAPLAGILLVALLVMSVGMVASLATGVAAGLHQQADTAGQLVAFTAIFTALGAVEGWLLATAHRRIGAVPPGWLRPGWWPAPPSRG